MRRVIVIAGPTASGKTATSMALATLIPCEVIIADARQIYTGMDIGTAKPTPEQRRIVAHHLVDIRHPSEAYNAAQYAADVHAVISKMPPEVIPVLVGGSGLYIKAALDGLSSPIGQIDVEIREQVQRDLDHYGRDTMYAELQRVDPIAANLYTDKNPRRITRALEVFRAHGRPLSSFWETSHSSAPYEVYYAGITADRAVLRQQIDARSEQMWNDGLLKETLTLLSDGVDVSCQSMQTVGYREAIAVITGVMTIEQAREQLKVSTWQYAKRQLTWFQRDSRYVWLSADPVANAESIFREFTQRGT